MLAPITNSEPISAESQWIDSEDEEDEIDAILAEEKDYDPFTLAPSTLVSVKRIQTNWETYCMQQSQKNRKNANKFASATEALRNLTIEDIKRYLVWYMTEFKIKKLSALYGTTRTWRLMYAQKTRHRLAVEVREQMTDYCKGFLCTRFNLSQDVDDKGVMSVDDLYKLFTAFWCNSDSWYRTERDRIQHALLLLLIVYTTARPATLLATDAYLKHDNSLRYRDIDLYLVREPEDNSKSILLMLIRVRLNKGKRNSGTAPRFAFYETDNVLAFCPVLHVLALAFADNAFSSPWLHSLSDFDGISVPDYLSAVPITWKPEVMNTPIMRTSVTTGESGCELSPTEGMRYGEVSRMTRRLGEEAGFQPAPTLYAFRRGGGRTLDKNATTAVRNQAMGHSRADIYEKYYTPQVVGADTQAAYLGSPSQSALIALAGRMSLTQDPRAHPCITAQVKAVMDTYVDSDSCCESRIASMRAEIKKRHGLLQAGSSTPLHTAYKSELRKRWQRRQAYRRAVEIEAREDYFRAVGDREIERQMLGRQEEDPQPSPSFCFGERRTLATLMCRMVDVDRLSHEERVKRRLEAFHNMKALCAMAEPKPHISRSPKRGASPAGPDDDGDDAAFDLVFTSLHCPWCFYNERASRAARATTFSKESNLLRHIDQHHLSRKTYGSDALCPYADCSFAPSSEEVLKNHLAREHGRRLRKKRLCNTPRPSGGAHITCLPIHTFEKKYLTTRPSTY